MIDLLKKYLHDTLGIEVTLTNNNVVNRHLPFALSQRYSVFSSEIFGRKVCFAIDNDTTTPFGYEKEALLIGKIAQVLVIIVIKNTNPVDTYRLIQKKIDFIVPGKRMFMPSLMIDLGGRYTNAEVSAAIPPLAQAIILYQIQKGNLNGLDAKEIAEKFGVTYLTTSRALKWIGEKIAPLTKDGKKNVISFPNKNALLSAAKPFLRTPVIKRIDTDDDISKLNGVAAGETALEEYSMIVASGICKAVGKEFNNRVIPDARGSNCIEVWMYDPRILAENGTCDKMSLILSLLDNTDERIHKEVEILKTELGWLKD